jgi:type IV pilus assembly protein PilM
MRDLVNSLLNKKPPENFVGIDIGASSIKLVSIDMAGDIPKLERVASIPTPANALLNNEVRNVDTVASAISAALEANDIRAERATFCLPGPAVFTKKIQTGFMTPDDLEANLRFEAASYIPHDINAVHLDFQVLEVEEKRTMDILLVAVKNEIIEGYSAVMEAAGLEPGIADVDYFALENMFHHSYPNEGEGVVVLLDIGARYCGVSILKDRKLCFSGDVPVGGRLYTDALCETLDIEASVAEKLKAGGEAEGVDKNLLSDTLDRTTQHIASEIHRQLGFFWNAAELDTGIEKIFLSGGASRSVGLQEELAAKTGIECIIMNPFNRVSWDENFDQEFVEEISASASICVGLAMRRFGDKENAKG